MALFYGQNIKCKYIIVMLYILMSCCKHQCYVCIYQCRVVYINVIEVNGISKAYTSVLYAVNRVLNVTNRCCLLYMFLRVLCPSIRDRHYHV